MNCSSGCLFVCLFTFGSIVYLFYECLSIHVDKTERDRYGSDREISLDERLLFACGL